MSVQDLIANDWIDWARPSERDADEFYQVEIRLSRDPDRSAHTAFAFWGNVGHGTPWRRTWRWRNSKNFDHELKQLSLQVERTADGRRFTLSEDDSSEPVVRTYRSVARTWNTAYQCWILDAVADDGTAWTKRGGDDWMALPALPQPDQPND